MLLNHWQGLSSATSIRARLFLEPIRSSDLSRREQMTELLFLGLEILFGVGAGSDFTGDALDHFHSRTLECFDFFGIVGEQADARDSESFEDLGWKREVAVVVLEPETFVGLDRVEPRILQFVGLQLGHQTDAASFLLLVDQNAGAFLGNH